MIICAGRNEIFDFARPIGVGLIESAINLTELALKENPTFLYFVGTAGSYGRFKIFDIIQSNKASNIELCILNNFCYTPLVTHIETVPFYVSRGTNSISPIINSSNYITTDDVLSEKMLSQKIELENMEFFSVLHVAKKFNLPCSGLFVVTNYCNKDAHHDYIQNYEKARELIILHVEKNIKI